jgi:hypothetical protein
MIASILRITRRPHRHVGVDAAGQLADHAGADHQLVGNDLGIGGGFLEGGYVELAGAHGLGEKAENAHFTHRAGRHMRLSSGP